MKNYVSIILILSLLIFAFGCKQETTPSKESPFIGGTTGLLISYDKDAPPAEVYDGGDFPFDVVVKLKNEGEYSVSKDKVKVNIIGIHPQEFSLTESDLAKSPDEDLLGKQKDAEGNVIEGTTTYVIFPNFNHKELLTGNMQYPIRADVCYNYATNVNSMLCIKRSSLDKEGDICMVNEKKKVFNSGAPVQVVDFQESPRGKSKFNFNFKIAHKGNGGIYKKDSKCEYTRANENKVFVSVDTGMSGLSCTGLDGGATSGYVTLYGGERVITCTQEAETGIDFEKPVNIELEYDYEEGVLTQLLVKHSP